MYYVYFECTTGREVYGVTSNKDKATEIVTGLRMNGFIAMYSKTLNLDEEESQ